jgi:serine/threonine-protein kinase
MDRELWQRLSSRLDEALALDEARRSVYLGQLAAQDPALAAQLQRLLTAQPRAEGALQRRFDAQLAMALTATVPRAEPQAPDHGAPGPAGTVRQPGQRLDAWELIEKIGEGGMGEVWRARRADGLYEAEAALKLLRSDLLDGGPGLAARFARERAVLARLEHPSIARLLDAGQAAGQAYLVLELVRGRSFTAHVRAAAPTVASRVQLLLAVARAVDHAHARLVVHRDLKPGNVVVSDAGEPKLLDFGIAGLLDPAADGLPAGVAGQLTQLVGQRVTLAYAAPEQLAGGAIGTATDVFALGVMLYELLCGERPFGRWESTRAGMEHALLHETAVPLRTRQRRAAGASPTPGAEGPGPPVDAERARGDLEAVAAKALRKDPAERYGSVREFINDLERWLSHRPVSVRREHWRHNTRLWLRRHALVAGAVSAVLLALSGGLAAATWQWQRAQQAAGQSERVTQVLADVLASASPERHGGQWPTVLQLLETSVQELPQRLQDDPATEQRLLGVMADTYTRLNRFDRALPLLEQLVARSTAAHGPDADETLLARLAQGRALQAMQDHNLALQRLEPLLPLLPAAFGAESEPVRQLHGALAMSYMHTDQFEPAEQALERAWQLAQRLGGDLVGQRASYLNGLHVLRNRQGRAPEALQVLLQDESLWASTDPAHARLVLSMRRNVVDTLIDLARYDRIEERSRQLIAEMERLMGPGNELALLQHRMLARYFTQTGQHRRAADEYALLLQRAAAAGVGGPTLLRPRAEALLQQARAGADARTLLPQARALLEAFRAQPQPLPGTVVDGVVALAELALLFDDAAFANEILVTSALVPPGATAASRWTRVQGQLARLQGDVAASVPLLQRRVAVFAGDSEPRIVWHWSAQLDVAYSLVLLRDPAAADTLQRARALRPPGMPPGHAFDAVADYLEALLLHGDERAPAVQQALQALAVAQGRPAGSGASTGRATLRGVFL